MNKKYLNITLIVLLVIIWSSVFYKYFGGKKATRENLYSINITSNKTKKHGVPKDTFQLKLVNRDPFGVSKRKKNNVSKPSISKTIKKVKQTLNKNIIWPAISYHGFVKSENSTTRLILLKIDNRIYRKREKDMVRDVSLVKAYNDSLIVSFNNDIKTITRQ